MPRTMKIYNGIDCWMTWFIDECNQYHLFGVDAPQLRRVEQYTIGTLIYLEDKPYFKETGNHRLCGPYSIIRSLPEGPYEIQKIENDNIVIYRDRNPSTGPWLDNRSVTRIVRGITVTYPQKASMFHFYPYRFSIQQSPDYNDFILNHDQQCPLCTNN